jgi:hypothetical protein
VKRYRFPLEQALRVRRVQQDQAAAALAAAQRRLRAVEAALSERLERYRDLPAPGGAVPSGAFLAGRARHELTAAAVLAAGAATPDREPALRAADLAPRAETAQPPRATSRRDTTPRAAPSPTKIVRAYYAALDAGRFARAWARLTPAVQARFGGFDHWRAGYATTLDHIVDAVQTQPGGVVRLTLTATDRTPCGGTTTRQFAVTWQLHAGRATALSAAKLAGQDPAAAC